MALAFRRSALAALAALALAALGACAPARPQPITHQGWWQLITDGGGALGEAPRLPVLLRQGAGRIETVTGCSAYSAQLKGEGTGTLSLDSGSGDPVGCAPGSMAFDARYLVALQAVTQVAPGDGTLTLSGDEGELRFQAATVSRGIPAAGSAWRLQAISFNGKIRAATTSPAATLTWKSSGLTGNTGCRPFSLPYSAATGQLGEPDWLAGIPGVTLALPSEIAPLGNCASPLAARQDGWLRGLLREAVTVQWGPGWLTITHDDATAIYRPA